jgi:hypothetical protein
MSIVFAVTTITLLYGAGRYLVHLNRQDLARAAAAFRQARLYRQLMNARPFDERWLGRRLICGETRQHARHS